MGSGLWLLWRVHDSAVRSVERCGRLCQCAPQRRHSRVHPRVQKRRQVRCAAQFVLPRLRRRVHPVRNYLGVIFKSDAFEAERERAVVPSLATPYLAHEDAFFRAGADEFTPASVNSSATAAMHMLDPGVNPGAVTSTSMVCIRVLTSTSLVYAYSVLHNAW